MKKLIFTGTLILLNILCFGQWRDSYDEVGKEKDGLIYVMRNDKTGFVDRSGKVVIPLMYDGGDAFSEGLAAVGRDGKTGFINKANEVVIPFNFDGGYDFNKGVCLVVVMKPAQKMWMIDKKGNQVTTMKYDYIHTEGRFRMTLLDKKFGYINEEGKEIVPPVYSMIHNVSEGVFGVKKDGTWGYLDTTGKSFLPFEYEDVSLFRQGLADVEKNGFAGVINKKGQTVIPFEYKTIYHDSATGWYKAKKSNEKWGCIDKSNKVMIPFEYDFIQDFSDLNEGYAVVTIDKLQGMINLKGEIVVPANYKQIRKCKDGICRVASEDGIGMYSIRKGKEIVAPEYYGVEDFYDGIAIVQAYNELGVIYGMGVGGKYGYVDQSGKKLTDVKYSIAYMFFEGRALVKESDKWGYIDITGKEVIKQQFDEADSFKNGKALVEKDGDTFYIDINGKRLSE